MKSFILLALFAFFCYAAADCSVGIKQTLGSSWQQDGKTLSQWNAQLTAGSETVKSVLLSISGAKIVQFWELTNQSNGLFGLPDYRIQSGGLAAGQVHQFGYIWESVSMASITVSSINCGAAASASPAAPASPSAAPASPSASPAAPSAAPSIVATPQPSGCSVSVTQTARSAAGGGSWIDGAFRFQLYDLAIVNNGNKPVTGAQITIALAAGQTITQQWNIELKSGSTFVVPNTFGPLQVGATLGAGYVLRSSASAGQPAAPAIAIDSVTCSGSSTANPSPAAPSASAAPASPSASPARPSPSPSTIVSTPQPSPANGCSAAVTIVARSASAGGVWTDNGKTFQIFDINVANNGQRPLNGGVITFAFAAASASITQSWELNRQGQTNVFNIAFNYGALQVGAVQGAGIIVSVDGTSPVATPTTTLSSLSCQ